MPKSRKRKLNRDSAVELESTTSSPASAVGRAAVRPGTFNLNGDFFTPEGAVVRRSKANVTPRQAIDLVRLAAHMKDAAAEVAAAVARHPGRIRRIS
jgi:hypothetical protein